MKTLNLKVVMAAIVAYSDDCHSHSHSHSHNLDSTTNCEPMMLWFHSNKDLDWIKAQINEDFTFTTMQGHPLKQGHTNMVLNGKIVKISDHPELLEDFILPSCSKKVKTFVYHRYLNQLEKDALQYCLDVVNIGKYPVVCLVNDYSLDTDKPSEELLSFINNNFDQYDIEN